MAHGQDELAPEPDETHVSPDGALRLVVFHGDDPMLGFDGFPWHVHGADYPELGAPDDVVRAWVGDILRGERAILECWKHDERVDVWTPEDNVFDFHRFVEDGKTLGDPAEAWRLRRWTS